MPKLIAADELHPGLPGDPRLDAHKAERAKAKAF
jgi:hypothetical protein